MPPRACFSYLFSLAILVGCTQPASHDHPPVESSSHTFSGEHPIKIVCTTGHVGEMIDRIGGKHVEVETLMGPGIDPHLYRPVASDVRKLSAADAIFYNGLHLEGRMGELFVKMARRKATYAVTEGLQDRTDKRLREPPEFDGMYDPHLWHDVSLWADCAKDMTEVLAKFDPANAADYRKNGAAYVEQLNQLSAYCTEQIDSIPQERRVLVTAHDAFGYFGKAYGLEVFGLKGISTEEEKDITHQEEIQEMIIKRQIPAVFVESAVSNRTVEALIEPCQAAGHDLQLGGELFADALGEKGTGADTYEGMIRHNVETIVSALHGTTASTAEAEEQEAAAAD